MIGDRTSQMALRLQKLLLMLSSDRDGEVVNAARAIGRTLQDVGSDWHDLAAGLAVPSKTNPTREDTPRWRPMVGFCIAHEELLTPREQQFVRSLLNWRGELTPKQCGWLTDIHERLQCKAT